MKRKLRLIKDLLKGFYGRLWGIVIFSVVYVTLTLISPLLFRFMIDNVIDLLPIDNHFVELLAKALGGVTYLRSNLWIGALLIIFLNLLIFVVVYFRAKWNAVVSEGLVEELRNRLFKHLTLLPYSYHVKTQSGDLIQRVTSDVDQIRRVFATQISQLVYALSMAIIAIVILFNINVKLAWVSVISMPIIFFFALIYFSKMQKAFLISDEAEGDLSTVINENLASIRVVKAFNRENYEIEKFDEKNKDYRNKTFRLIELLGVYWSISDFICFIQILAVIIFGIHYAKLGQLTVGDFFVFISYENMILWPIRQVGRILSDLGKVSVSIERLQEILDVPVEDIESGITPSLEGDIVFEHVTFKYDDSDDLVLDDLSFTLKKGETLAIMGPTGSGKSSLVHLLMRLYEYNEGSITVNGHLITDIQKKYLRANVGLVLQEPFLFSRSIFDNIKMAKQDAEEYEIQRAATIASVAEVIEEFEKGYDTLVGERGVTLSGGQKQRVAIARTMVLDTPILIFDDSLSAVDTETDAAIRAELNNINHDVTTLMITQRVAASESADRIIIIENGKVSQEGTHQELLNQEGLYKRVYDIQSRIVLGEGDVHE